MGSGARQRQAGPVRAWHALGHGLGFAGLMTVRWTLLCVSRSRRLAIGEILGMCCYRLHVRRGVVEKNVACVNMAKPGHESRRFVRNIYRTTGRLLVDMVTFSRDHVPPVVIENEEGLRRAAAAADGVLLVSGHYGNWELLIHVMALHFPEMGVIAKPMRNPWLSQWIGKQRAAPGVSLVTPRQAIRRSLAILRRGHAVAILIDQYAGRHGTKIPFLGRPALTVRSAAGIAALTHCKILAGYAVAAADGTYHVRFRELPNPPVSKKNRPEAVLKLLHEHNEILTSWIRSHPEQWFGWFHRRFKDSVTY